jgi:hypothetical protein
MMVVIKLLLVVPPLMHLGKASMTFAACNKERVVRAGSNYLFIHEVKKVRC